MDHAINKMGLGPFQMLITVFCGLLWLADTMEFMILSVLSPLVKCQWGLSTSEEALITSVVFLGFFLGGLAWGAIADIIGRKRCLFIVDLVILVFGVLSAVPASSCDGKIPGYPWLLVCRFGVGIGAGGTSQVTTYYAEFLPLKRRGACLVLIELWWAVGTMLGVLLALAVLKGGGLNWHWYLLVSTIPLLLVLFLFPFVPESARFYLIKGKDAEALKVLQRIAWYNQSTVPSGRPVLQEDKDRIDAQQDIVHYSQGTITIIRPPADFEADHDLPSEDNPSAENDRSKETSPLMEPDDNTPKATKWQAIIKKLSLFFTGGMWRTTILLLFLWLGAAWLYYGVVLLTTSLLQHDPHCGVHKCSDSAATCEATQLDTNDYFKILWTTAAEIPGIILTVVIIELLGRKITMFVEFIGCMVGFLLLYICASDILLTFFLSLIRAFAVGVFQAIFTYTPEVYPTRIRALGMGICTSAARIGALVTPYVAQVLWNTNDYVTLFLYAGSSVIFAVLALLLPIETKGRALQDSGKSRREHNH